MGGPTDDRSAAASRGRSRLAWATERLAGSDPSRIVLISWWLSLVSIWVVQGAHEGQHERHELPLLMHLFRDAALAVPLAAAALVGAGFVLAPRLRRESPGARGGLSDLDRFIWVLVTVAFFAALSIPGHELHGALFGVEQSEVGWVLHALLDASIAAIGAFIALFPIAMVVGPPVRRARSGRASRLDELRSDVAATPALIARSTR
jgi:hypothetical protein